MKILYDQQIFSFQDYGGISRYFYELIKGVKQTNNTILVDGKFSNNVYLSKLKSGTIKILSGFDFPYKNVLLFYLNKFFDSKNLKKGNFDIIHATYYQPYFLSGLNGKPYVVTVYDMTHELFTKECKGLAKKTLEYKQKTICGANKIIAISKNTKKDLISLYGIQDNRIEVVYLGNPLEGVVPSKVMVLPERYLLFVGNRVGYKNFDIFVKAVEPILKQDENLFLVCAGGGKFSKNERRMLSELIITRQVKQVNFGSDNELAYIYKHALVYILPSLYEGFGMTTLEAFSMGCPVVASNTSSIPEVCGKAVVYVDPKNEKSIKTGVEWVMTDNELRNSLIKLGFEQINKFSWDRTVEKTLKVYKQVLSNQKRQGKK